MTTHDAADGQQRDNTLRHLPLRDLELFCAHELQVLAEEGGIPNDHYPLELFRRAVVLREAGAWAVIYRQYAPFVLPWLLQLPQAKASSSRQGQPLWPRVPLQPWPRTLPLRSWRVCARRRPCSSFSRCASSPSPPTRGGPSNCSNARALEPSRTPQLCRDPITQAKAGAQRGNSGSSCWKR